jgi:hypothetical protein
MGLVAQSLRFADGQLALVDFVFLAVVRSRRR